MSTFDTSGGFSPSCWGLSPPEGDSKPGQEHSSCGFHPSHWSAGKNDEQSGEKQKNLIKYGPVCSKHLEFL